MLNKLLEELEEKKLLVWCDDDWYEIGYNDAIDSIKQLVEHRIIQCKNCKHGKPTKIANGEHMIDCLLGDNWLKYPNWFCADGEEKP